MRHILAVFPAASVLVTGLILAACVPATSQPSSCADPAVSISATLSDSGMQPAQFDVCRDQEVTITVASQVDGELHFHGYDTEVPEQELTPGQSVTVKFTAAHPGQFPIELHPADGSDEREVAKLVVNQP